MGRGNIQLPTYHDEEKRSSKWPWTVMIALVTGVILFSGPGVVTRNALVVPTNEDLKQACYQPEPRLPKGYNTSRILEEKERVIDWLSGAVQIPTQTFDDMLGQDEDPRWDTIRDLHDYLEKTFPLVHKTLDKSVHDLALVYEWPGSDSSLKPIFLTSHLDVVPVLADTLSQWQQPPFSGHFDGKYIWGRGASDTKSSLVAVLGAIEHLLETTEFKPRRGIVLGFGSNEEGGKYGAPAINKYLLGKYGKDAFSILIDEGSGLLNTWGQQFALPGVAEKGSFNLELTVETLGGHSSVPPQHTGIGLISLLLAELEQNPHDVFLVEQNPIYGFVTCAAGHASGVPTKLKDVVVKARSGSVKAWNVLPDEIVRSGVRGASTGPGQGNAIEALMRTTQAADIIHGGIKVNALPEQVKAQVNHRVNVASDHVELQDRIAKTLLPVVRRYNLTLVGFDDEILHHGIPTSKVLLSSGGGQGKYLDPAPISPTDATDPASSWTLLSSTARGVWASRPEVSVDGTLADLDAGKGLVVAPYMSTGNTDTARYWDLTRYIYRFRYAPFEEMFGAHTINEHINADSVVELTRFYQAIILNFDQADTIA